MSDSVFKPLLLFLAIKSSCLFVLPFSTFIRGGDSVEMSYLISHDAKGPVVDLIEKAEWKHTKLTLTIYDLILASRKDV